MPRACRAVAGSTTSTSCVVVSAPTGSVTVTRGSASGTPASRSPTEASPPVSTTYGVASCSRSSAVTQSAVKLSATIIEPGDGGDGQDRRGQRDRGADRRADVVAGQPRGHVAAGERPTDAARPGPGRSSRRSSRGRRTTTSGIRIDMTSAKTGSSRCASHDHRGRRAAQAEARRSPAATRSAGAARARPPGRRRPARPGRRAWTSATRRAARPRSRTGAAIDHASHGAGRSRSIASTPRQSQQREEGRRATVPEQAADHGREHGDHGRLAEHHPPHLARRRADQPEQAELAAPGGHHEAEGAADDEDRHEQRDRPT